MRPQSGHLPSGTKELPASHVEVPSASLTLQGCPPCTHFPHAAPPGGARLVRGVTITTPGTRLAGPALGGHGEARAARGRQPGGCGPDLASWGRGRPPPSPGHRTGLVPITSHKGSSLPTPGWVRTRGQNLNARDFRKSGGQKKSGGVHGRSGGKQLLQALGTSLGRGATGRQVVSKLTGLPPLSGASGKGEPHPVTRAGWERLPWEPLQRWEAP